MCFEPISPKYDSFLKDESNYSGDASEICFAENAEEARAALLDANAKQIPVTFQGARTGFLGGAVPKGSRILNFSKLTQIGQIETTANGAKITVACGASLADLQSVCKSKGYFFPVEPTEDSATLGGMYMTAASGVNAYHYGGISSYIDAVEFLTRGGEIWHLSRHALVLKAHTFTFEDGRTISLQDYPTLSKPLTDGLDFLDFLAGSEGAFGAPLSLSLRLAPLPKEHWAVLFFLKNEQAFLDFAQAAKEAKSNSGAAITAAEFYNAEALQLFRQNASHPLLKKVPAMPKDAQFALYLELEGDTEDDVSAILMDLLNAFEEVGGQEADTWAESGEDAILPLKQLRHALVSICNETEAFYAPNGFRCETDCAFPKKNPKELLQLYQKYAALSPILYGSLFLGELHMALEYSAQAEQAIAHFYQEAKNLGGLPFHKYGIGKKNALLCSSLYSPAQIEAKQKAEAFFKNIEQQ